MREAAVRAAARAEAGTEGAARAAGSAAARGAEEDGEGGDTPAVRAALVVARMVGGAQQRVRHLAAAASLVDVNNDGDGDGERRWATVDGVLRRAGYNPYPKPPP